MDGSPPGGDRLLTDDARPEGRQAEVVPARETTAVNKDRAFLVDVKQAESEVVIYADLPGLDEDDIDVDFRGDVVRISGEREFNHDSEDSEEYVQLERPYGRFVREIALAGTLDTDRATAKYHRGVLKIRIPKLRAT